MIDTAPAAPPPAPPTRRARLARKTWRFTVATFALIGLFSVTRPFLFDLTPIASGSMSPTLKGDETAGDWVLAEKISYYFRPPRRFEVVEFHDSQGVQIMKRVTAFPGESIAVQNNALQLNGSPLAPPTGTAHIKYYAYGNLRGGNPYPVADGYYLLGDDSIDSGDSRFEGPVPPARIRARAWLIVWPPSRIGWVR